ncbi:RNA polymerase subunit sigma-24 (plasmid) [Acaryochloris sp. 'Moss Beach']|uniref:sigma-70 family RNA polymerase sigma factor n=1 Tax=Acaryochloris sp. 'Moss Beach' TaxID=2740837 RepID=UPI001F3702B7|nr:sigma-70 domain-containing protein [Acaryochloris sp. 'Moss Beach']UJB73170.1 RNA polymerase subunit sigma-24 [Acaryochloris sp. 'Moss Beach']
MIGATSRNKQSQTIELLTREEEYDLILRIKVGDERASRQLIHKNKGLITKEVKRYGFQVDHRILNSAGEMAVVLAARGFKLSTGNKFSTYLVPTLWSEVRDCFCREAGISRNTLTNLRKISNVSTALSQELGREPTLEEIAERSGLSQQQILTTWQHKAFVQPLSFNQRFDDDCPEWLDFQSDETVDPWRTSEEAEILTTLDQLQGEGHLEDRQVTTLIARHQGYNNREVGEELGLSRERVRQLFKDAASKVSAFVEGTLKPKTITPVSTHHTFEPVGEGDQLPLDLPAPEEVREPAIRRVDASRLGGRISKVIKRIFNQTNKESHIHDHGELTNAQEHILVLRRCSNHGIADVARHRLTPENQRCRQLERTQDDWRGYLGFSPVILRMLLLPLALISHAIKGFQHNDQPNERRSIMSFFTTDLLQDVGIGYRREHPRPPNNSPDFNESLP